MSMVRKKTSMNIVFLISKEKVTFINYNGNPPEKPLFPKVENSNKLWIGVFYEKVTIYR